MDIKNCTPIKDRDNLNNLKSYLFKCLFKHFSIRGANFNQEIIFNRHFEILIVLRIILENL